ncbi:MAG: AsnC family transcriptional regulator [Nitrospirota bacterium]|jgi:DNA-binding Lrp family transcriptional regulator
MRPPRALDEIDRAILNRLQAGFPVSARPFAEAAGALAIDESDLIARIDRLLKEGLLTRFGPLYDAQRMGGGVTLAAMEVPEVALDAVAEQINAYPEIAHNYVRNHPLNLWFVLATERPEQIAEVLARISRETGVAVYDFPKEEEFFIGLQLRV